MTRSYNIPFTIGDLQSLLDVYGADRSRWPGGLHSQVDELLARDIEARARLREAEALDHALDLAPQPGNLQADALTDRILAAAIEERGHTADRQAGAPAARPGDVVSWPGPRKALPLRRSAGRFGAGRAATLLAASLVLGIYIGNSNAGSAVLEDLAAAAGLSVDFGQGVASLDQSDLSGFDEEAL